jgi:hypothetical protein
MENGRVAGAGCARYQDFGIQRAPRAFRARAGVGAREGCDASANGPVMPAPVTFALAGARKAGLGGVRIARRRRGGGFTADNANRG